MFKTAEVRSMRNVFSSLWTVSLALLLVACTPPTSLYVSESKSWVVENVAGKSTAELYADSIAPAVFERSGSKQIDGYTVESGNLVMPDKSRGSLVTVRSKDGSLTAVVERSGKNGLLVVNSEGEGRFIPYPVQDYSLQDTIVEKEKTKSYESKSKAVTPPYVIDMLIGYSRSAVAAAGGDAQANALAQVESVNLALRNSLVSDVSIRLVGVQVVAQNYPITPEILANLPQIFSAGMQTFDPDMLYGIFSGHPDDSAVGWGYQPGRTAIGLVYGEAFRHEVGHNAGGGHCHESGGSYNYGFNNGKSSTAQCGNGSPYYSTPAVRDQYGLPLGNAATADMARVWRENAERLSSYAPPVVIPAPTEFKKIGSTSSSITFSWKSSSEAVRYEIYKIRPGTPSQTKIGDSTGLVFTANYIAGEWMFFVKAVSSLGMVSKPSNIIVESPN